jgi:hypothetical protein
VLSTLPSSLQLLHCRIVDGLGGWCDPASLPADQSPDGDGRVTQGQLPTKTLCSPVGSNIFDHELTVMNVKVVGKDGQGFPWPSISLIHFLMYRKGHVCRNVHGCDGDANRASESTQDPRKLG